MADKVKFTIASTDNPIAEKRFSMSDVDQSSWYPPYLTGQIIFVEDKGQIFLDFHGTRRCYSVEAVSSTGGVNYVGISTVNPATGHVSIPDNPTYVPQLKDMVAFGNKEYLYRKDEDGHAGWYEVGDEDAPAWEN